MSLLHVNVNVVICLTDVAKSASHLNLKVGCSLLFILSQKSVTRIQITSKRETVQDCACRRMNCWQATKKVILHNNLNAHHESEHKEFKTNRFGVAHCRVTKSRNLQGEKLLQFH
jgi:hypothetical protein